MGRTRVRRRRIGILLGGALAVGLWSGPVANALDGTGGRVPAKTTTYVVRPGDTLWSIARSVAPGHDPRLVVDAILGANRVQPGALMPGQSLSIPA
jgi:nucleoid-associated protein YgaU